MDLTPSQPTIEALFQATYLYEVPRYQRAYSWEKTNVETLWSDLASLGDHEYFLGPVVLHHAKDDGPRSIIDGQQRITTLQILLALIRDEFVERGDPVRNPKVAPTPYSTKLNYLIRDAYNDERFRLKTGEYNRAVLEDFVLREPNDERRKDFVQDDLAKLSVVSRARNQDLIAACVLLRKLLKELINKSDDPISRLERLETSIRSKVTVFVLDLTDLDDAFLLFETLNDRGLRLSAGDLLKSHLLASFEKLHAGDQDALDAAARDWDDMVNILGGGDISGFLRHYLLINERRVKKDQVFRLFKSVVKDDGPDVAQQRLTDMAVVYSDLDSPPVNGSPLSQTLQDLKNTGVDTYRIVMMPALAWLPPNAAASIARTAEILAFRWNVTSGNAQELETIFHEAAKTIDETKGAKAAEAVDILRQATPDDAPFRASFERESLGYQYVAAYALRRIESSLYPNELMFKPGGQVHLEHIMPRTSSEYWREQINGDQAYEAVVERWGNLTLLLDRTNQSISNNDWTTKRHGVSGKGGYDRSAVKLTSDLVNLSDWTSRDIALRARWLAAVAVRVWSESPMPKGMPTYSQVRSNEALLDAI